MATKARKSPYRGPKKQKDASTVAGENLYKRYVLDSLTEEEREGLNKLNPVERETIVTALADAMVEDKGISSPVNEFLWEEDYRRKPVDIDTFIHDDYYLGRAAKDLDGPWKDDLRQIFAVDSQVSEFIMTGAIGIGKTTIAMVANAYTIYRLSCLKNPSKYYGVLPNSKITIGLYSITKTQTQDTGFFKLRAFLDVSEYFSTTFPRDRNIDSVIRFKDETTNIEVIAGSRELHALGRDVFSCSLDEANFMVAAAKDKDAQQMVGQAYELYRAVSTRMESRFMRAGGSVPGLLILMSSRKSQSDFLENRLKTVTQGAYRPGMRGLISPRLYISDYALWEVKAKYKFPMPHFRVQVGDRTYRSRILKDDEQPKENIRVISVPGDFHRAFEEDADQALRDIAGVATIAISPLIRDRQSLIDAERPHLLHPFTSEWVTISTEDDYVIEDFFKLDTACRIENSKWTPRLNPTAPRFLHIDLSITGDAAGISMAHASGKVKRRTNRPDGTYTLDYKPFVIVDFMLRIVPPTGSETDLSKVRSFILYLREMYPITRVTFDGYQSVDSAQILNKAQVESGTLSVDRTEEPYVSLRAAFFERRIACYHYERFYTEMLFLERDINKKKIDHPQKFPDGTPGSKDVADSCCGSVWWCLNDPRASRDLAIMADDVAVQSESRIVDPPKEIITNVGTLPAAGVEPKGNPGLPGRPRVVVAGAAFDWSKLKGNVGKKE